MAALHTLSYTKSYTFAHIHMIALHSGLMQTRGTGCGCPGDDSSCLLVFKAIICQKAPGSSKHSAQVHQEQTDLLLHTDTHTHDGLYKHPSTQEKGSSHIYRAME